MTEPMTLAAFAAQNGIRHELAAKYARRGFILGAQQLRSGAWVVYPPAKLLRKVRRAGTAKVLEADSARSDTTQGRFESARMGRCPNGAPLPVNSAMCPEASAGGRSVVPTEGMASTCQNVANRITGRPTYYADPFVLACCRRIAAAAAAIKGGKP